MYPYSIWPMSILSITLLYRDFSNTKFLTVISLGWKLSNFKPRSNSWMRLGVVSQSAGWNCDVSWVAYSSFHPKYSIVLDKSLISIGFTGDKLLADIFCQKEASNFQAFFHTLKKGWSSCAKLSEGGMRRKINEKKELVSIFCQSLQISDSAYRCTRFQ